MEKETADLKILNVVESGTCTGCSGCYNACSNNAINMKLSKRGFIEPIVNKNCVKCGNCSKHCPILNKEQSNKNENPSVYAVYSNDIITVRRSTSGGTFTELAKKIISQNGYVYGVILDENLLAKHISITNENDLYKLRGAKYIQSHVNDSYKKVVEIAKTNKVLFTGTPCQVSALNTFIDKDIADNIITCEIICHSVPSEIAYTSYLKYMEKQYNSQISSISFREKTLGWENSGMKIVFKNSKEYFKPVNEDPFTVGFLCSVYSRESCHNCQFAKMPRSADITIGDFWGVPKELKNDKGTSVVLCNSVKGKDLLNSLENITIKSSKFDDASRINKRLVSGVIKKDERYKDFYKDLDKNNYKFIIKKYLRPMNVRNSNIVIVSIKKVIKKIIGYKPSVSD